jgi:AcrR family transcriptional regulator
MLLLQEAQSETSDGKKIATRQRLIVAAAILFQQRGYHGVKTDDILVLAKAPRGSLYHHFPGGKTDLAYASIDWLVQEVIHHLQQMRLKGYSPSKIVKITTEGIAQWMKDRNYSEGSLLAAFATCLDHETEDLLALQIGSAYSVLRAEYEQMLLVAGVRKSTAQSIATQIIASIEGATLLARAQRSAVPLLETANRLSNLLVKLEEEKNDT